MKTKVVIGFLGTQLDAGMSTERWSKWRPSVSLMQQEDLQVERFELLYTINHEKLALFIKADIANVSPQTKVNLVCLSIKDSWDFGEVYSAMYDWSRAYAFDTDTEEYWAHITTGTHVAQICTFLLVESRLIPGVLLQTSPAKRERNPGTYALIDLDLSRYNVIAQRFAAEQHDAVNFLKSGIATRNPAFNQIIDEIERVAVASFAPILLTGPTGAGKSYLARRMFELKKSRHKVQGQFVEVNCATLQGDGAASTLFGHKRGSFTGAVNDRAGMLRSADKGVLFLDEIGELGLDEQAMLLTAIEDKRFFPVGSDVQVQSDFQLIAGTNRDLRIDVIQGRFREDLFARINLWSYDLPGLAQRPEDIEPNIDYVLAQLVQSLSSQVRFNQEAKVSYLQYAKSNRAIWAGNFRDLSASVTRMATLAEGGRITEALVGAEIKRLEWLWSKAPQSLGQREPAPGQAARQLLGADFEALDLFDQIQLEGVLSICKQSKNLSEAGRRLFGASRENRSTPNDADRLRKYLLKFGLRWEQIGENTANSNR